MKKITKVAVIGAGLMGSEIAQACIQVGLDVALYDIDGAALSRAKSKISRNLARMADKGLLASELEKEAVQHVHSCTHLHEAVSNANLVIEAIPEKVALKKEMFAQLDEVAPGEAIFASNTSSISITEIASATKRADRVIGLHFFTPVPLVPAVEVISGLETSNATMQTAMEFLKTIGKEPLTAKDFPGFVVNRLLPLLVNECFYLLWEQIATAEDIDRACTLILQHPMGPLRMADLVGLDTVLLVIDHMHQEMGEKYRPCPLLKQLVHAGRLGRKTNRGVYDYGT